MNSSFAKAVETLRSGGTILYPTDTIWGLGCDATNPEAVETIFRIKQRPEAKSLVLLVSDLDMLTRYVKAVPEMALDLIEVNDKPMTIIYPEAVAAEKGAPADKRLLSANCIAEDGSVGIRIPLMEELCAMIRSFGRPIVSTSANVSGEPSPHKFADIPEEIRSAVDFTVDPALESASTGLASQIIKLSLNGEFTIIRM